MGFFKKKEKRLTAEDARFITDGKQVEPEINKILTAIKTKAEAGADNLVWDIDLSRFWALKVKEKLKELGYKIETRDGYIDFRRIVIRW